MEQQKENNILNTLNERGKEYGIFLNQASLCCRIKDAMIYHRGWAKLAPDQRDALEMIATKISRIINGNPNYADSWHDIAGYAKLVEDRLNGTSR